MPEVLGSGRALRNRAVGNGTHFCDTTERASQRLVCSYKGGFPKVSQKWGETPSDPTTLLRKGSGSSRPPQDSFPPLARFGRRTSGAFDGVGRLGRREDALGLEEGGARGEGRGLTHRARLGWGVKRKRTHLVIPWRRVGCTLMACFVNSALWQRRGCTRRSEFSTMAMHQPLATLCPVSSAAARLVTSSKPRKA